MCGRHVIFTLTEHPLQMPGGARLAPCTCMAIPSHLVRDSGVGVPGTHSDHSLVLRSWGVHGMLTYFPCAIGSGLGKQGRGFPSHRQATRWLTLVQGTKCGTLSLSFPTGAIPGLSPATSPPLLWTHA